MTENACPLLQLLNYFIIIGKLYLWDCRSKQIPLNIYEFRAKIIAKYETEEKNSNKEFSVLFHCPVEFLSNLFWLSLKQGMGNGNGERGTGNGKSVKQGIFKMGNL